MNFGLRRFEYFTVSTKRLQYKEYINPNPSYIDTCVLSIFRVSDPHCFTNQWRHTDSHQKTWRHSFHSLHTQFRISTYYTALHKYPSWAWNAI